MLRVAAEEGFEHGQGFIVGTMIELPRACFVAGDIARHAEFFSFGTNDLTQTGLGFSRDDIEARIIPCYMDRGIVDRSPFGSIDEDGVESSFAWASSAAAPHSRSSRSGSAASTAATPTRSGSSIAPDSTM